MTKISRTVRIGSSHGLHARPAKLFAQAAKDAGIPVTIAKDSGTPVNAASILGVIALAGEYGDYVTLTAEGDGADAEPLGDGAGGGSFQTVLDDGVQRGAQDRLGGRIVAGLGNRQGRVGHSRSLNPNLIESKYLLA